MHFSKAPKKLHKKHVIVLHILSKTMTCPFLFVFDRYLRFTESICKSASDELVP